jgi:hypothetical protein
VLNSHFHEDLDSDAKHACRENIPSHDFREVLAGHGSGIFRIRHGYKQPHANFITRFTGLKKDAGTRDTDRAAQIFKVVFVRVGRADAHELRNLATAAAAPLLIGNWLLAGTSCWVIFRHQVVLGRHGDKSSFRKTRLTIRKECIPSAIRKPIVGTYPEGSRTFQQNGSTEVLEKEGKELWKRSDKLLIETKKREIRPKLVQWRRFGTNSRPVVVSYPQLKSPK